VNQPLSSSAIGARLEGAARASLPVLVFVYTAGYMLGQWIHSTNDRMAAAYLRLLGLERPPVEAAPVHKPAIRATLHKAPLTVEALCKAHTQRELMVMAGTKSKRSKKQLAERILKTK
jgi:hypothetical protein